MEIGLKAFYGRPTQARSSMKTLKERGIHVSHISYYKKQWGHVENFNARGNVTRKVGKNLVYGAISGFLLGGLIGYILLATESITTFQDMSFWQTVVAIGAIGAFTIPAFSTALAVVFSEDKVDIDESDFNGDQVVVDFHIQLQEKDKAEQLLKKTGAHNIIYE
ncbi:MAG: hypothetical protein KC478_07675 [Bacteriovoracaceae bacterium]|nr:hypothetical protein [Bacteriovoracaceae bacterium]